MRVLVAGVSTRALAASAARAGFDVTAIDAFADVDQHPSVDAKSLDDRFSPAEAAREAEGIACDAVAYGANFENHPDAVAGLARGRALWGNGIDVLRRVRDPKLLSEAVRRRGFCAPAVGEPIPGNQSPQSPITNPQSPRGWLAKPRASGGGHGIRRWHDGMPMPRGSYLQEFIDGTPASIVFAAARGGAVPLGVFRQLIGDAAFGASAFRYCGNILTPAGEDDEVVEAACALASAVCEEFALVGVNGIDFIVSGGAVHAIEVNPRWCASMELVERAYGLSIFGAHAAACGDAILPKFDLARARRGATTVGKAVVFARREFTAGDPSTLIDAFAPGDLRDVPRSGMQIRAGHPICTVLADARDSSACYAELVRRAAEIYRRIG